MNSIHKPRINNQIRAPEVRVIDEDGTNIGVKPLGEALRLAEERGTDLIEVADKAQPPVVRLMEFGKYQYQKEKQAREAAKKQKEVEVKGVRVGLSTSRHDMAMKAKRVEEFLGDANKVKIDFILKGRAKYLDRGFLQERLRTFLSVIETPFVIVQEPKKGPRGLSMIIEKQHEYKNKQIVPEAHYRNTHRQGATP